MNTSSDRWRVILSDGKHFAQTMLATQQNSMILDGHMQAFCFIKLTEHLVNVVQGKPLIIVLNLEVLSGPQPKMGNPTNVIDDSVGAVQQQTNGNTGPYGGNKNPYGGGGDANPYGADIKPKVEKPYGQHQKPQQSSNPYGQQSKPANPYGGGGYGNNSRAGGGSSGYGGGGMRGGGASNPYANRSSNSAPVQRQSQDNMYLPLSALNPYQNRWIVKARITNKSNMKRWSNPRGEGTLFSIDLLDEAGSEMRGTFFKADADKWYDSLQAGNVYSFQGGRIKVS
ncbi:unnamed protein product, partial [Sphacelaria rigidula]